MASVQSSDSFDINSDNYTVVKLDNGELLQSEDGNIFVQNRFRNNLVIDFKKIEHDGEVVALVKSVSNNRPTPQCDLQQQILEKKQKVSQYILEQLAAVSSLEEMEAFERIVAPLKPTLAAVRDQLQSNYVPLKCASISAHKNIEPQRRLRIPDKFRKHETRDDKKQDSLPEEMKEDEKYVAPHLRAQGEITSPQEPKVVETPVPL
ncbi:unnamed protein product [Ceutorhynchus assimilis]|uniref:Uncharacterized protein n=1 Tax=Ceutorhynchus assimilis TaxID=467358 RepID=A0A9N9MKE0_9CUCU|nr:unnamed protein product [Ceutorhynchus assimilis]